MSISAGDVRPADVLASILVAFNLALAQPLLDLLGRNAVFFVARDSTRLDVVLLALLVTVVIPVAMAGGALLVGRLHAGVGAGVHAVVLVGLGSTLGLVMLKRTTSWPGPLMLTLAIAFGLAVTLAFFRSRGLRSTLRFGLVLPVVVLALFLIVSPVSEIVFPTASDAVGAGGVSRPAPVVMVIFDEFPIASVMDRSGGIDAAMFPNLARLARSSTWFRNATTVHTHTAHAVPALLDGRLSEDDLPTLTDHPQNLFTVLADDYELHATEPVTQLCPAACRSVEAELAFGKRWRDLVDDLRVVTLRMVAPDDLAERLPTIGEAWGGFAQQDDVAAPTGGRRPGRVTKEQLHADTRVILRRFLQGIRGASSRRLHFLHVLTPHQPWRYLPSGRAYPQSLPIPGSRGRTTWGSDEWLVTQAYQRHLLQVGFVDRWIGQLIDRLRRMGTYDDTLLVLVADHGIAFRTDHYKRTIVRDTIGDIAAVPLFVKRPRQTRGHVDDRPAETIDVFPTIADVLGIDLRREVDGTSLFQKGVARREKVVVSGGERLTFGIDGREKIGVVARKFATFGPARGGSIDVFDVAPPGGELLLGRSLDELATGGRTAGPVYVDNYGLYEDVSLDRDPFPSLLSARLPDGVASSGSVIAVALNGRVVAVTRTYGDRRDGLPFYAMLPPGAFRSGANDVEIFLVQDGAAPARVLELAERPA